MALILNSNNYEYKTNAQANIPWGESFKMSVKAPLIADRIFKTYSDADSFVHDRKNSAIQGLVLTVISNSTAKGLYFVDGIKRNAGYIDDYGNVYEEGEVELVLVKVYIEGDDNSQSDWAETNPRAASYIRNKPNITDNVNKNTISLVGRVDFVDGNPKVTRSLIESEDGIIKLTKKGINYLLYGTVQPSIRITWVEYNPETPENIPNSFTDFETAERYFENKDKSIYPEYIRCGNVFDGYNYYYLSFEKIDLGVNVDEETIVKGTKTTPGGETINCLKINVPKLKIYDYNMLEDDDYIKPIDFKPNEFYDFNYVEVSESDYQQFNFKVIGSIPNNPNIESYRFIKVGNICYIKTCFGLDDVYLADGSSITQEMLDNCIFLLNGVLYEDVVINDVIYFIQKTITDGDNLLKSMETLEKLIYYTDLGKYNF